MKRLIVNADDFGWSEGVNRGIVEAYRNGIVTSTTVLANGAAFDGAVQLARQERRLGVGVHLNLSDGAPLLPRWEVPSLVNEQGHFSGGPMKLVARMLAGKLRSAEVEAEWDAQIRKVEKAGIQPTHLDGHKHVHMLPALFPIALRVSGEAARDSCGAGVHRAFPRLERHAAAKSPEYTGDPDAARPGARAELDGHGRPHRSGARGPGVPRILLRPYANRLPRCERTGDNFVELARRNYRIDVPPGIPRRGPGGIEHAPADAPGTRIGGAEGRAVEESDRRSRH